MLSIPISIPLWMVVVFIVAFIGVFYDAMRRQAAFREEERLRGKAQRVIQNILKDIGGVIYQSVEGFTESVGRGIMICERYAPFPNSDGTLKVLALRHSLGLEEVLSVNIHSSPDSPITIEVKKVFLEDRNKDEECGYLLTQLPMAINAIRMHILEVLSWVEA